MVHKKPLNNLVVVSDLHAGCRVGLCPPDGARMDDGGRYEPSELQRKLWAMWVEFWDKFVPEATRGEPFAVCCLGDALDGVHHRAVTQISHNLADQADIAERILRPVVERCEGRYYHVRGTEAHVGPSAQEEERLARLLGAIPNEEGQRARYELWFRLAENRLIHLMHHVGTTGSQAYEATAVHKELVESFVEAGRWGEEPPDMIVRAHRHRYMRTEIATDSGQGVAVVSPGWQGKTPFTWKIAGARLSPPQFGGLVIRVKKDKYGSELFVRPKVWTPRRSREES